jgi:hypothetical protein
LKLKITIKDLLKPEYLAFPPLVFLYYVIITTLDQGTSCDEGWYLLGYSDGQTILNWVSDFDTIVKSLFGSIPESIFVISLRWIRFILGTAGIITLTCTFYLWIRRKYTGKPYLGLILQLALISGALTFGFGVPTLYYDNIQLILFLFIFSLYFSSHLANKVLRTVNWILIGSLTVLTIVNYLPSGIFLTFILLVLAAIENHKLLLRNSILLLMGFCIGLCCYHLFFADIFFTVQNLSDQIIFFQTGMNSNYKSGSMVISLLEPGIALISLLLINYIVIWISHKFLNKWLIVILMIASLIIFLWFSRDLFYIFRGYVLFIPLAFALSALIYVRRGDLWNLFSSKIFMIIILMVAIPILGVLKKKKIR